MAGPDNLIASNKFIYDMKQEGIQISTTDKAFENKNPFPMVPDALPTEDAEPTIPQIESPRSQASPNKRLSGFEVNIDESVLPGEEKSDVLSLSTKIRSKKFRSHFNNNEVEELLFKGHQKSQITADISAARSWIGDQLLRLLQVTKDQSQKLFLSKLALINVSIHGDKDHLFYSVERRDLYALKAHLKRMFDNVSARDVRKQLTKYTNAVGANIIHHAYLIEAYEIAHWLVESYPEVALEPYSHEVPEDLRQEFGHCKMPYSGENILHMVIVRRDFVEVRWLLDFYRDHKDSVPNGLKMLLVANATGYNFDISGEFYFGGYPLQFAVCSNSIEIFDLVLSFASSLESDDSEASEDYEEATTVVGKDIPSLGPKVIFMRDSHGNTVLHLCVMHCLKDMFDHVYEVASRIISREIKLAYSKRFENGPVAQLKYEPFEKKAARNAGYHLRETIIKLPEDDRKFNEWVSVQTHIKLKERLLSVLNKDLHSLLTLAAVIRSDEDPDKKDRKIDMLKYLLGKLKTTLWTMGKLQCSEVDLAGLDVKYDLNNYAIKSRENLPRHHSAISWLCIHDVEEAIMIPEIRRIIEIKWERCGLTYFLKGFVVDSVIVILLTLILAYDNYTPTSNTNHSIYWFINILYALVVIAFLGLVGNEFYDYCRLGNVTLRVRGLASFHVYCRAIEIASFIAFAASKFARFQNGSISKCQYNDTELHPQDYTEIKVPLVVCVMTAWVHIYYYLMAFQRTGPFVLTLVRIITRDVPHFLRFYVISLFAFASTISLLGNTGNYHFAFSFRRFFKTLWTLIHETVNNGDPNDQTNLLLVPQDLQWLSDIMNCLFYYGVAYIMLNLLIAIINSTYSFYTSYNDKIRGYNNEAILLIEKFNVMDYLEHHMSPDELHTYRDVYAMAGELEMPQYYDDFEDADDEVDERLLSRYAVNFSHDSERKGKKPYKYFFQLQEDIPGWFESTQTIVSSNQKRACLLIIAPQNDFLPNGAMPILGMEEDSKIIADTIVTHKTSIHSIFITLDSRHPSHISHAKFWLDRSGSHPLPGAIISNESIAKNLMRPRDSELRDWCLKYTAAIEKKGRKLVIMNEHCIIGTRSHAVCSNINDAVQGWAEMSKRSATYITTGMNKRTEMYSAIEAELEDPTDENTAFNSDLMSSLRIEETVIHFILIKLIIIMKLLTIAQLIICGSASSIYVQSTVRDILKYWRGDLSKLKFLENGNIHRDTSTMIL